MAENTIYTGSKWLGRKILIESSGDEEIDDALKSTFHDKFHGTRPLDMWRADVKLVLKYQAEGVSAKKQPNSEIGLFE